MAEEMKMDVMENIQVKAGLLQLLLSYPLLLGVPVDSNDGSFIRYKDTTY